MNVSKFTEELKTRLNGAKNRLGLTYFSHYEIQTTEGKKFLKVYRKEIFKSGLCGNRSIVAFVNKETGDIFKPASFNAPAKHPRGNVNSPMNGMESITPDGHVIYLRD